jgi:hypothetical protein
LIVRSKFLQIQTAIADQERRKLAEERARIEVHVMAEAATKVAAIAAERDEVTSRLRQLKAREATTIAETETRIRAEAQKVLDAVAAQRDEATSQLEDAAVREAAARQQAVAETETRIRAETQKTLEAIAAQRDEVASQLEAAAAREAAARQQAVVETEIRVRAEAKKTLAAVTAQRDEVASQLEAAAAHEAATRQQAIIETETRIKAEAQTILDAMAGERDEAQSKLQESLNAAEQHLQELHQQRRSLEVDRDAKLLEKDAEHHREREQLQKKIESLTRTLQHKTANELGDGAEINIYETLRDTFIGDDITRIKKGQPGADIRHRVIYKGAACGTILIDSKNRQGWQNAYVSKLREDQVTDDADHAVLVTTVFPTGKKDLYIDADTGIVVVSRAQAIEMIRMLRDAMVRMHCLGLSLEQRAEKRDLLYAYITSEGYRQHMSEVNRVTSDLLSLEAEEKRAHDRVWDKRGRMTTRLRNVARSIGTEVSAIVEGHKDTQTQRG